MHLPSTLLRFTVLAIASTHLISAQLVLPQEVQQEFGQENLEQIPIKLDFGWHTSEMDQQGPQTGPPLLSDILGIDRSLSIFAGLGRSLETVAARISDPSVNTTLLVPTNSALQTLPRKPWEDKPDEGDDPKIKMHVLKQLVGPTAAEDKARKNLEQFVYGHVITKSPIKEGEEVPTLLGTTVSYKTKQGEKFIYPGNIKVVGEREAANGAIWVLDGVIE